jgi:2-oxoglutarate ferredoxin oxidoreductase subunit beta
VARTIDVEAKHLQNIIRRAYQHRGTSFIEILQNCNIFNDGAWEPLKDSDVRDDNLIRLVHGEPIRFGKDNEKGVIRTADGHIAVVPVAEVGESQVIRHDAHAKDPGLAFALSRLANPRTLTDSPIGIFRDIERPSYDRLVRNQVQREVTARGAGDLQSLITGSDTWSVS